jgi:hypothetical protein
MCTKLSSQQNMKKKILFQNFSLFSPVSLTPLINIQVEYIREFSKKFKMVLMGYSLLRGPGDTDLWKKSDVENLCQTSFKEYAAIMILLELCRYLCSAPCRNLVAQ